MNNWSKTAILFGILSLILAFGNYRGDGLGLNCLFEIMGLVLLVCAIGCEYDANVEARKAWMAKSEIRRAELYYCVEWHDADDGGFEEEE